MEIRNFDAYSPLHKSGHTSKGDQLKWQLRLLYVQSQLIS